MSEFKEKIEVYVDSDNRLSGTHTNFTYKLNLPSSVSKVALSQASIPKSWYNVSSSRNSFTLTEGDGSVQITVPEGNYSLRLFRSNVAALMTNNSPNGYTYTILYPSSSEPDTGKLTITVSDNGGVQPTITFQDDSNLHKLFGFNRGSSHNFAANQLMSTNVVNFQKSSAIHIYSDLVKGNHSNNQASNILQEIYSNDSQDFSRIAFQNTDLAFHAKDCVTDRTVYNFKIIDDDGQILSTGGLPINFSLVIYS